MDKDSRDSRGFNGDIQPGLFVGGVAVKDAAKALWWADPYAPEAIGPDGAFELSRLSPGRVAFIRDVLLKRNKNWPDPDQGVRNPLTGVSEAFKAPPDEVMVEIVTGVN